MRFRVVSMTTLHIPIVYLRDKQVFADKTMLRILGKPVDVAKRMHEGGIKLIHIIDSDALRGLANNLDVYDKLTYFVNVEVETAPVDSIVKKLLSLKCRVVLVPDTGFDVSKYSEKKLLVAKIPAIPAGADPGKIVALAAGFHDVILATGDEEKAVVYIEAGKRVILSAPSENLKIKKLGIFGILEEATR